MQIEGGKKKYWVLGGIMNFRLTSLLTVLSLCFACAEYAEPSLYEIGSEKKTNKDAIQKKIVNGSLDTVHGAVVAVIGDVTCTGTIITPTVVLTAAHCIGESGQFYNPREVWVTNAFDQQPVEGAAITAMRFTQIGYEVKILPAMLRWFCSIDLANAGYASALGQSRTSETKPSKPLVLASRTDGLKPVAAKSVPRPW